MIWRWILLYICSRKLATRPYPRLANCPNDVPEVGGLRNFVSVLKIYSSSLIWDPNFDGVYVSGKSLPCWICSFLGGIGLGREYTVSICRGATRGSALHPSNRQPGQVTRYRACFRQLYRQGGAVRSKTTTERR